MATRDTAWPHGAACWADVSVDDLDLAKHRYGRLFGWDGGDGPVEDDYVSFLKNGRPVAGLGRATEAGAQWTTYFSTADVAASVDAVRAAGGRVLLEPTAGGESGRFALCADPGGAVFGFWQAGTHLGFGLVEEPGAVAVVVLLTRDVDAAVRFYSQALQVSPVEVTDGLIRLEVPGEQTVPALVHQADQLPDDAPEHWLVTFEVASRDATVAMAEMEDPETVLTSFEGPGGAEATLRGAEGEVFDIVELPGD